MKGNSGMAAKCSDTLNKLANSITITGLSKEQLKIFNKENGKILHNSEHIRDNGNNYPHQCEHFDYLSGAFLALIKKFRFNTAPLYYFYSPDGNGDGANWLTDKNTLNNRYFKGQKRMGDKLVEVIKSK